MTSTVSLDESGNVGSQDRYFVMSALIVKRTSDLNKPFKLLDEIRKRKTKKKGSSFEVKFSHSYTDEKMEILNALSSSSVSIVFIVIDKKKSKLYSDVRNCDLYRASIREILPLIDKTVLTKDVNLNFDENLCISMKKLTEMVKDNLSNHNVKSVRKVNSSSDKAVQLADFVSGSIREKYEHGNDEFLAIIKDKISIAHET
ncbi:MAG: DUF3800 domain-containing protein [Thermoplasmata archaeon]|nr:DUF3800 domain-containing protein [Thermoplasmata archaeon]